MKVHTGVNCISNVEYMLPIPDSTHFENLNLKNLCTKMYY